MTSSSLSPNAAPKTPQTLPAWLVPHEYDLTLHPNTTAAPYRFEGCSVMYAEVTEKGKKQVVLHAKELLIISAKWESMPPPHTESGEATTTTTPPVALEAKRITYDAEATEVHFEFAEEIPVGRGKLTCEFIGTHNDQMAGFYRSSYQTPEGETKIMVSTQFEALDARRCFPCVDEPAAKAFFKATLVVDEDLTALSNMPECEVSVSPAHKGVMGETPRKRKKRVTFLKSPKMSTYLLAFAVGEFDFLQARTNHGVMVRVFTPPAKSHLGKFALHVATRALDLFDDYFGVPYPLPKLDMIAVPEFAMGAMENWGLVTYREVEVLVAEDASADQRQRVCTVITHELSHQWFGNLVTMNWWTGLWLNEGFASWMQTFAADAVFPEWEIWSQFVVDDQATALSLDALVSSHPIEVPIGKAEEVEEVFDAISYHKGACVVQLANAYLGGEDFRRGLQTYMARHAYQNTATSDLWKAWEEVSGKPVREVMKSWTEQMGFPLVTVSKVEVVDGGSKLKFTAAQRWFLADGSPPPKNQTWSIPLIASFGTGDKSDDVVVSGVHVGLLTGAGPTEFVVEANAKGMSPDSKFWLKLNAGQNVPMRVAYDAVDADRLLGAVRRKELSGADRAGLLLDAFALAKAGVTSPATLIKLVGAYENEDNMAVWDAVEQVLGGLSNLLRANPEWTALLSKYVTKLIKKSADRLGWEARAEDTHLATLSRAILVRLQCKFSPEDPEVKRRARELFEEFLRAPVDNTVPADLRVPAFRVALANGSPADLDAMLKALDKCETIAQKKDVYAALGFTPSIDDKRRVLDWCTSGKVKLQDFFYPMSSVAGSGAGGGELAFQYMKSNFARIHAMIAKASPSLIMAVIAYCCGGFASTDRAKEIEEFFKANPVPLAARKISQIVENTNANASFLKRIESSKEFLDVLKA